MDFSFEESLEKGFPGFGVDTVTFNHWALKGVVRTVSRVTDRPTEAEWHALRKSLEELMKSVDESESNSKEYDDEPYPTI